MFILTMLYNVIYYRYSTRCIILKYSDTPNVTFQSLTALNSFYVKCVQIHNVMTSPLLQFCKYFRYRDIKTKKWLTEPLEKRFPIYTTFSRHCIIMKKDTILHLSKYNACTNHPSNASFCTYDWPRLLSCTNI